MYSNERWCGADSSSCKNYELVKVEMKIVQPCDGSNLARNGFVSGRDINVSQSHRMHRSLSVSLPCCSI